MRRILLLIALALLALGVWSLSRPRAPRRAIKPAAAAAASEVPIPDGKTLDFSSGKPVVKDSAAERAELNRAVKAMDAAAAGVTFAPVPAGNQTAARP